MVQPAKDDFGIPVMPAMVPPPKVVDATGIAPRLIPTSGRTTVAPSAILRATDARAESMMSKRPGYVAPPPAPLTGPGTFTQELGSRTFNDFDTTSKVAANAVERVQKQPTMAGKVGAAAGSALMTVPALAMDAIDGVGRTAMDAGLGATVRGAGDAAKGFFGITDEPAKPAVAAPAAVTPAAPAAPAKATPAKPPAMTGPGTMSGSIPAPAKATPAPAADGDLYAAGMKYADDLKRINQRLIDTGTVTGGPLPAMSTTPAAPATSSVQSPFAGSRNPWDKMWNAQWNAAALKNAQQVGVQQANAGVNAFNAETQRKQVDQMPVLEAGRQAAAQKVAETSANASIYGADAQLAGVAMTNANRRAIEAAKLAQRQAELKGSEAPPTVVPLADGGIVMVGRGGVAEYKSSDMLKADGQIRAAVRAAAPGEAIKDSSGTVLGTKVVKDGKVALRLSNGEVVPMDAPQGKTSIGMPVPATGE
jgi:hypothetical protein